MNEIKLNKRYKYVGDIFPKLIDIGFDIETATDFLNNIKDAEVVEVVRCKDCKHCWSYMGIDKMHYMKCTFDPECDTPIHEMHFCSYGERKEDEGK